MKDCTGGKAPSSGRKAKRLPFPGVVRIEPAAACNLKCSHCPTGTIPMRRGLMSDETFRLILEQMKPHLTSLRVVVLYHGGEPLLHPRLAAMVREVKDLGVPFVKTVSNGMLLDGTAAAALIDAGLDAIEISLDGTSPDENDRIRRGCSFDVVRGNVHGLAALKGRRGASRPEIYIASTQFVDPAEGPSGETPPPPAYLLREFSQGRGGEIAGFKCTPAVRWPGMTVDDSLYRLHRLPRAAGGPLPCEHVEETLTIRWNGEVVPCCYDLTSRCVLGSIGRRDLESIWNGEVFLALRESFRSGKLHPLCGSCALVSDAVTLTLRYRDTEPSS